MVSFNFVVVMACGEFITTTICKPVEKLNNWSQLASTGNMVRYVIENLGQSGLGWPQEYQEAAGNALAKKPLSV